MLTPLSLLALSANPQPPLPPYRRLGTTLVYESAHEPAFAVAGDLFVTADGDRCVAYDLRTMRRLWSVTLPKNQGADGLAVREGTVYLTTEPAIRATKSRLLTLDARTGRLGWSIPREGKSAVAVTADTVYVGTRPDRLAAIDRRTRAVRWTATLPKAAQGEIESIVVGGTTVALSANNVTVGLSRQNGTVRWQEPNSYLLNNALVATDTVIWVPSNEGAVVRDLTSGKRLWSDAQDGYGDYGGVYAGQFVGIDHGRLHAVDPRTGRARWSHPVGPGSTSGGNQYGSVLGDRLFVCGMDRAGIYDPRGKALWSGKSGDAYPRPIWSDGTHLVAFDDNRLMRYVRGQEPPAPTGSAARQALAQKLVARFGELDAADKKRLTALGDDAFPALLRAFLAACAAHDAVPEDGDSYPLYSKYQDLGRALTEVTTRKRGEALMKALDAPKTAKSAKPALLTLLARSGDPKIVTPYFLRELEGVKTPGFEMYESNTYVARQYIVASRDPRAVAFMLKQLRDPKADATLRFEAYVNLANTGGEEGLRAVLAARNARTSLRPLAERVTDGLAGGGEMGAAKPKLLQERTDAQGRTWGLLQSGVLGDRGDLWLVEKVDGQWRNPLFTGVSTSGVSRWVKPAPPEPTIGGRKGEELAKGAWFDVLVANEEIRRDADGDGLTDLVERRLSTDPAKADTDGDGDPDGVDPWPNAPRRTLNDSERVLAAVFEARYHDDPSEGPALLMPPPGLTPFEMPGRRGPTLWSDPKAAPWTHPLERLYEHGIALVRFYGQEEKNPTEANSVIQWNADRTTATVGISIYYGGLNGTGYEAVVRKFGDEWVVVSLKMAFVS
jgi:outer membrane protein assembly factor BamB